MKGRKLLGFVITVAAMAFVTVSFAQAIHEGVARTREGACKALRPDPLPSFLQGTFAPDFALPDANGRLVKLSDQKGHPVFLNFWATWCPPCIEEMPSLETLASSLEASDVRVLAVSVDESWDLVRRFFAQGTKMGVLVDTSKEIPRKYGTEKFPETYLIDAEGRVRYYFINKRDWSRPEAVDCLESLR